MTPVNTKKWLVGSAVGVALGGALVAGVASVASADATATPSSPSSTTGTSDHDNGTKGTPAASKDTPVTGDEATKVSAAVTAKDSTVTVTSVRKDPDGSYDALGTKAGTNVMYDVSADLATITQAQGHGGRGGPGGSSDTAVTGDEATKVSAAVTAKDSAVTVTSVRKDADGSYDVLGTKDSVDVFYEVSADLGTVTLHS
jgi:hypothetical protein